MNLTQKELKKVLSYDPETGVFVWLASNNNRIKAGMVAGTTIFGYILIRINGKRYRAHRLAFLYMTGRFPPDQVDHINLIRDDNRFVNIREASIQQNSFNRKVQKNNKLGIKGVSIHQGRFRVSAKWKGKETHLGSFSTPEEANEAYQDFTKRNHGEFYREARI